MDAPFEPFDPAMDPGGVDELRVRRLSGREHRADPELARLRTALEGSAARIAELEDALAATRTRLAERVQEVSSLAAHRALAEQLEAELAREREARRHADDLLSAERDRFARVLAASQLELRDELDRVRDEGRAAVDAARRDAVELREQLAAAAAQLDRVAAESRAAGIERAALEQELRTARAALAERGEEDDLRAQLAARAAAQERAVAELSSVRPQPDAAHASPRPAPLVPPADHPALGNVPDARAVPDSVIADLARAAERLRELAERDGGERESASDAVPPATPAGPVEPAASVPGTPAAPTDPGPAAPATPVEPATSPAAAPPAPTALVPAASAAPAAPAPAASAAAPPAPPAPPAAPAPAPSAQATPAPATEPPSAAPKASEPLQVLLPPLPERPTAVPWLAPALADLAREDAAAAGRLLLDLLPVQGLAARRPLAYAVDLEHGGRHLVRVAPGHATVQRDVSASTDVPVRIAGGVAALAPLVAGGRARPHGARVAGRRWRLRRLLRDLRAPVGLPELARAGVRPDPADLLALLAASVPPARTRGNSAVVSYVIGGAPRAAVVVGDGAPLVVLPEPGDINATAEVHTAEDALLALLAGTGEARARGDLQAVERLHRWLRLAQGLDA